jgi:chemotaxis protein histidine kinase CheA
LGDVVTEIRSFYSIKEINEVLEESIEQYKSVAEEYSQWLGSFLRDSEAMQENEEWAKQMAALQKTKPKEKSSKATKKKGKSKRAQASTDWVQFKELMLSASELGEAEILFEAIEEINRKIEQLKKMKESIAELEKSRLGKDITYITYIRDGVPEKIVLRHRKDQEFEKKFQYMADFSVLQET